ncbi:MAG: hypothetical protein J7539_11345 [Niabella sp.]|nr:hypothetical protein [Niabella sp.]
MSDLFNAKRFALFFRKTIAERPILTVGVMALLLILSILLYTIIKKIAGFGPAQNITMIWGLAGGSFLLTSFVFGYFGTNANGCSYLTLPVSFLEKWLCAIIIVLIIYPVLFLLCFHITDSLFVAAYHNSLDPASPFYKQFYESVYTLDLTGFFAWKVYSLFLTLTGCMLVGGLYFNKAALIKTSIAITLLTLAIIGINWLMAFSIFRNVVDAAPYNHVVLSIGRETGTLILPTQAGNIFSTGLKYVIPGFLWLLPLIRLREKEF